MTNNKSSKIIILTLSWRFLYDNGLRHERVKWWVSSSKVFSNTKKLTIKNLKRPVFNEEIFSTRYKADLADLNASVIRAALNRIDHLIG